MTDKKQIELNEPITTWYGRPITDMTREELIEAMNKLGNMLRPNKWKAMRGTRYFLTSIRRAK